MPGPLLDYNDIAARYKRTRSVAVELNNSLLRLIPKKAIESTARKLGLWQDGVLVFDIEEHSSVLMDYGPGDSNCVPPG